MISDEGTDGRTTWTTRSALEIEALERRLADMKAERDDLHAQVVEARRALIVVETLLSDTRRERDEARAAVLV